MNLTKELLGLIELNEEIEVPPEFEVDHAHKAAYRMGFRHGKSGDRAIDTSNMLIPGHTAAYKSGYKDGSVFKREEVNIVVDGPADGFGVVHDGKIIGLVYEKDGSWNAVDKKSKKRFEFLESKQAAIDSILKFNDIDEKFNEGREPKMPAWVKADRKLAAAWHTGFENVDTGAKKSAEQVKSDFPDEDERKAYLAGVKATKALREFVETPETRTADQLELNDRVVVTGNVDFKGVEGEISRFGKDKKFVVVKLDDGGEHTFHATDVSEVEGAGGDAGSPSTENANKFYVAFYDQDEERSWIGTVTREHGGKWHEKIFKGKPEFRWGTTYPAFMSPDDIMKWLMRDYGRRFEIEGPFYDSQEAQEHVSHNWGELKEAKNEQQRYDVDFGVDTRENLTAAQACKFLLSAAKEDLKHSASEIKYALRTAKAAGNDAHNRSYIAELEKQLKTQKAIEDKFAAALPSLSKETDPVALTNKIWKIFSSFIWQMGKYSVKKAKVLKEEGVLLEGSVFILSVGNKDEYFANDEVAIKKLLKMVKAEIPKLDSEDRTEAKKQYEKLTHYTNAVALFNAIKKLGVFQDMDVIFSKDVLNEEHISEAERPSLRLLNTHTHNNRVAKVYRDRDWEEYRVKFFDNGKYTGEKADYHTDDKGDANSTADHWVKDEKAVKVIKPVKEGEVYSPDPDVEFDEDDLDNIQTLKRAKVKGEASEPTHSVTFTKGDKVGTRSHRYVDVVASDDKEAETAAKKKFKTEYPNDDQSKFSVSAIHAYESFVTERTATVAPWDVLNLLSTLNHKRDFEDLDLDAASKYVDMAAADKIADKEDGKTSLMTLAASKIKAIINKHPHLLVGKARRALADPESLKEQDYTKTHKLVLMRNDKPFRVLKVGETVKDFRGDPHKIEGWAPGKTPESSGRVYTDQGSFYPSVINAEVQPNDSMKEGVELTNFADWKSSVLLSHPAQAQKIKFHGKMEGDKTTVSAVIPGEDKVYGIWDDAETVGTVLSEARRKKSEMPETGMYRNVPYAINKSKDGFRYMIGDKGSPKGPYQSYDAAEAALVKEIDKK